MTIARLVAGRNIATVTCDITTPVRDVVALLAQRRIGAMPVLSKGTVAGIISERDIVYRLHSDGPAVLDERAGEVMTAPAVTVMPETEVTEAMALMTRRRVRHLPVMENGHMTGFVSIGDLVKYRIDLAESEAEAMRTYIQTA